MVLNNNERAFLEFVAAGLWGEVSPEIRIDGTTDWQELYRLATEQSVLGLVLAGLEHSDVKPPQVMLLQWIGEVQVIEQRNKAMNAFIANLISRLRKEDIYTLLVKGQGIAQCYERPLWRACGDVDLYLSKDNYEKAKALLNPLAQSVENEDKRRLHLGMNIDGWVVELHGTMYTYISKRINKVNDEVHQDIFFNGNVRSVEFNVSCSQVSRKSNGATSVQVFLPSADNDVIVIFNHFINHFYGEGVGLRQICDWCRLLYTYRESLNHGLLEQRIRMAGLMTEWRAFGAFAVEYLGMPEEAMPLFPNSSKWKVSSYKRKAEKICRLIIETGNFGHNKDEGYRKTHSKLVGNFITAWKRFKEFARIATIFPMNAPRFYITYLFNRIRAVV